MSFLMPFLRKQFAFWRIFLYFLAFTTLYAKLASQFLFSNLSFPTGVGVLSNAVLFGYAAFFFWRHVFFNLLYADLGNIHRIYSRIMSI